LARRLALQILSLDCYKSNLSTRKILSQINDTQSQLREIQSLQSGGNPLASNYIIPIYNSLLKTSRRCVESDYFYYLLKEIERVKINDPCNKSLILKYRDLLSISKELSVKENIEGKITEIENCNDCQNKELILIQLLQEGKSLYLRCNYKESLDKYNLALTYRCSEKSIPILNEWNNVIKPDIQANVEIVSRFATLKRTADSLMALQECSKALVLYQEAKTLNSSCANLDTTDLSRKISYAECCTFNLEFSVLVDSSRRARINGYYRDACRFLDDALKISSKSTCISSDRIRQIVEEQKVVCCRAYPERKECITIIPPKDSSYFSLGLYGNTAFNQVIFNSGTRAIPDYLGWNGYSTGIIGIIGDDKFGEVSVGGGYSQSFYYVEGNQGEGLNEKFEIHNFELPVSASFWLTNKKKDASHLFLHGSALLQFPIRFRYENYLVPQVIESKRYLNSAPTLFRVGLGYKVKRLSYTLYYERLSNLLSKESLNAPIRLNSVVSNRIGFELRYRLFVNRNNKTTDQ